MSWKSNCKNNTVQNNLIKHRTEREDISVAPLEGELFSPLLHKNLNNYWKEREIVTQIVEVKYMTMTVAGFPFDVWLLSSSYCWSLVPLNELLRAIVIGWTIYCRIRMLKTYSYKGDELKGKKKQKLYMMRRICWILDVHVSNVSPRHIRSRFFSRICKSSSTARSK